MKSKRKHTNICVIESRWWREKNTSVKVIFDVLADMHTGSPHGYDYEVANNRAGFEETLKRQLKNDDSSYIAIATHGSRQGLELFNDEVVSRAVIRNILKNDCLPEGRNTIGVHLGCCTFLDRSAAEFLNRGDIGPWWLAGYSKSVDWIESTALDLMFFNKLLLVDNNVTANPVATIKKVAFKIAKESNGLAKRLGFQIYLLEPGSEIQELI